MFILCNYSLISSHAQHRMQRNHCNHRRPHSIPNPSIKSSIYNEWHTIFPLQRKCFLSYHCLQFMLPSISLDCMHVLKAIHFQPATCYFKSAFGSSWDFFILLMFSKTDLICCAILQALPLPSFQGIWCSIMNQWQILLDEACVNVNTMDRFRNDPKHVMYLYISAVLFY